MNTARAGTPLCHTIHPKSGSCRDLPWGRPSFFVVCRLRSSLTRRVKLRSSWKSLRTNADRADAAFATAVSRFMDSGTQVRRGDQG